MDLRQKFQIALVLIMTLQVPPSEDLQTRLLFYTSMNTVDDALDALAVPYIKDPKIREWGGQIYWCGTPALEYLAIYPEPSEEVLIARAARMEVSLYDLAYNQLQWGE